MASTRQDPQVDGRAIAARIIEGLKPLSGREPKRITFAIFSDSEAVQSFVARKEAVARELGVSVMRLVREPETTEEAVAIVDELNISDTNGIVVQLPLPEGIDTQTVLDAIDPELDVDVLGTEAKSRYRAGETERVPPVAGAVEEILKQHTILLKDKRIVVLGRGRLVGEPVGMYFDRQGTAFDYIDINTSKEDFMRLLTEADIIVSGIGVPHLLKPEMFKEGVVLIDAGTSSDGGLLKGDIDPASVERASLLTPVPGGVGPITVAVLFRNLFFVV